MVIYECHISQTHTQNECNVRDLIKSWSIECVCMSASVHTHIKTIICIAKHSAKRTLDAIERDFKNLQTDAQCCIRKGSERFHANNIFLFCIFFDSWYQAVSGKKSPIESGKNCNVSWFLHDWSFSVCVRESAWVCVDCKFKLNRIDYCRLNEPIPACFATSIRVFKDWVNVFNCVSRQLIDFFFGLNAPL